VRAFSVPLVVDIVLYITDAKVVSAAVRGVLRQDIFTHVSACGVSFARPTDGRETSRDIGDGSQIASRYSKNVETFSRHFSRLAVFDLPATE
jgi:hypothetical protein